MPNTDYNPQERNPLRGGARASGTRLVAFRDEFRLLIKAAGGSSKKLAKVMDVSTTTILRYWHGKTQPQGDTPAKIAKAAKHFGMPEKYHKASYWVHDSELGLQTKERGD